MDRISRRQLLQTSTAALVLSGSPLAAALPPTPAQTEGPFYPQTVPLDQDADLVQIVGQSERASGTILHLTGRLLDPDGRPVRASRIEIWQCDAFGYYHHVGEGSNVDPFFQGFGHATTNQDGAYRFRTIVPVPYTGRTPHIHVKIKGRDYEALTTQMYLAGQPQNEQDFIYRSLGKQAALVTVPLTPAPELEPAAKSGAMRAQFDIVLGPGGVPSIN